MKKQITREEIIELWLKKYHNLTVAELIAKEPKEFLMSTDWFNKYAVTQEQHDEWYAAAIDLISKRTGFSKKFVKKSFAFDYLDIAPNVRNG